MFMPDPRAIGNVRVRSESWSSLVTFVSNLRAGHAKAEINQWMIQWKERWLGVGGPLLSSHINIRSNVCTSVSTERWFWLFGVRGVNHESACHQMMNQTTQGCWVRFFGSKGLIKYVKVLEPSNSSMCKFGNRPPPTFESLRMFINNYTGKNGAGMGPCHHCRAEKGEPSGAVQVPRCTNP